MLSSDKPQVRADGAWSDLDRRFRTPLSAYFRRRLANSSEAEDLTQEVFVRLTRRPDRNNGETLEAYIFKIASSVLADWRRSQTSHRADAHRSLNDVVESVTIPKNLVEDLTPERVLAGKETLHALQKALSELNKRTRDIFLLSRMEHIPHRDIARQFGISVSAVEKHILKAIAYISARALR